MQQTPVTYMLKDDGLIPNNPDLPLVLYRGATGGKGQDLAAHFEEAFERNGWGGGWRNGIYPFDHYHSQTHEVLGIARGSARVQFGGPQGQAVDLSAGDVAILPAGTGHKCLQASNDLLVVGAYPASGTYDLCRPTRAEHDWAVTRIAEVFLPDADPLFGVDGQLRQLWRQGAHGRSVPA